MIRAPALALAAALTAGAFAASAQTAQPDSENGRYSFKQMGEEMLRLDGRTGQVSLCSKRAVGWSCLMVPDERTALETEINRLQGENVALKRELIDRGIALPNGLNAPQQADRKPPEKSNELTLKLPSDADVDRMMSFMEKIWRRLVDMVQSMQKEIEKRS